MAKICNECVKKNQIVDENKNEPVPFWVFEETQARNDIREKHLYRIIVALVIAWFLTNIIWIEVFNSYDYSSEEIIVEQDAQDGGNNNYIENDGDINNGVSEDNDSQEETN